MTVDLQKLLDEDTQFGFLDSTQPARQVYHPQLISNVDEHTMLRAIREELRRSEKFTFSVAFITTGALAFLKQALLDFPGTGTIITSTYLRFNQPDMFRELLGLAGVDVFVHPESGRGFHPKGYLFEQAETATAIIGSSNLTARALCQNEEWNLRFSTLPGGDIVSQLKRALDRQLDESRPLTSEWIDKYEAIHKQSNRRVVSELPLILESDAMFDEDFDGEPAEIVPNMMQTEALQALGSLHEAGEKRAVIISATGTGKTILSALEVRAANPERMLFIAHREQILDAAIEEFQTVIGMPDDQIGKFAGPTREIDKKHVFATIQSIGKDQNLRGIAPDHFDYVLIDEVHRAGAESYRRVIDYLKPDFLLGMTATPERMDGFNVFELFDFNVPYEIRLKAALEADMLAPFHYYGVSDYVDSAGETITDTTTLSRLVAEERVDHLIKAIESYGHTGRRRGLIFCSRNEEAVELSERLNLASLRGHRLRTRALSGQTSIQARESAIRDLEDGKLDYLITVDIFNEGIDIPSVDEVIMLRQTQSSVIFTQQLGRGLRKAPGKDHLRVIDFIGNYKNNYLIPIALLGDSSLNKDVIRKKLIQADEDGAISGLSSINFDSLARDQVLRALASSSLESMANLKASFLDLKQRLGRPPSLLDFARFETTDPVRIAVKQKNYWSFLHSLGFAAEAPNQYEAGVLTFMSAELLNGKRPHELLLLRSLLAGGQLGTHSYLKVLTDWGCDGDPQTRASVERVLSLEFFTEPERRKFGSSALVNRVDDTYRLSDVFEDALSSSSDLRKHVEDVLETGLYLSRHHYDGSGRLIVGEQYSRKDVCRLLNWKANEYSTIYGYKVDRESNSCPIFVTYHKASDVSESTAYDDEFLDNSTLRWFTRSKRTLESAEVRTIVEGEIPLHVFAKKDDADGRDFTYLGEATPRDPVQTTMPSDNGRGLNVVVMNLHLQAPLDNGLYRYLTTSSSPNSAPRPVPDRG